ncbi:Toxin RelG [Marinomonas spartinae]|uniref:Toxin RelG n=1 Tax=Marinomonas spartinae TaxID=1792290 RepID=A0A1A8TL44_9GAMM|nr:type II toxin-antitoxin system RelE/ParE family toxin [Marinomonas spartinae]SBS33474.1 Toxin RelG [Marinomonas spartinae]SBS34463.1 Toxin RelG [Marinomonas spartinae]
MTYAVKIASKAQKELKKVSSPYQKKIVNAIKELAVNPMPIGVKKLKGQINQYRIRVADYRVIYEVHGAEMIILVIKVGHRQSVYQR